MTKIKTTDFFVVCKESRIENNTSFYGCFYLGPFDDSLSQTLANDLRRTLLSELTGLAITSIEIEGVLHKFSSIPGMKESVLDLISNFQNIILKKTITAAEQTKWETSKTKKTYIGFLNVNGPRIIKAKDLKLPSGLQCVDPNQYIATLAQDGFLNIKFNINEGKNFIKQKPSNLDVNKLKKRNILMQDLKLRFFNTKTNNLNFKQSICNTIPLDAVFMPVTKINCIVEENKLFTDFSTDGENTTSNFQKIDKTLFIGCNIAGCFFFKKFSRNEAGIEKLTPTSVFTAANEPALNLFTGLFEKPDGFSNVQQQTSNVVSTNLNNFLLAEESPLLPASRREDFFPDGKDLNFADFFLNYTKKPQTCFVPTKNPFKLIPWESNTLYFDLLKSDLLDISESTKSAQPSEHLVLFKFLKKKLKEDQTTFNVPSAELKIFLALNKRHLQKKTDATQQTFINSKAILNQSNIKTPSRLSLLRFFKEEATQNMQKKQVFKIKHEKLQQNLLLEYNKTLKLKPLRKKTHVIVEIWTNGSIHPREALYLSFNFLSNIFLKLAASHRQKSFLKNSAASIFIPFKNNIVQSEQRKAYFAKKKETAKPASRSFFISKQSQKEQSLFQKIERDSSISLKAPIGVLPISLRVYTALKKEGILTIEDLLNYTKKDLLKIKNFGVKSLFELETLLSNLGYFVAA